eukprot:XP_011424706.1 PREDICTED: uncharacterized protein LOC105326393 [Crassostrea gigas]
MKIVRGVLVVVFVLLVEQTEAFIIDHARLCEATHVSHGFRRDTFQKEAIHYCYPTNITNGKCEALDARAGINCTQFGENYVLQGGLGKQRASCCEKKGIILTNCTIQPRIFSHDKDIDVMYFERVLTKLISIKSAADPKSFEIELCTPKYISSTTPTPTPTNLPPPPPVPSLLDFQ